MSHIIAVTNRKGGVGKTSVSLLLAAASAQRNLRTAIVDLDPEGNAAFAIGLEPLGTAADLLLRLNPAPITTNLANLSIFPGGQGLDNPDVEAINPTVLHKRLEPYPFDVVICDCPPQLIAFQRFAICSAQSIVIVSDAHPLSVRGVSETLRFIENERADADLPLERIGLVFNRVDTRRAVDRAVPGQTASAHPNIPQICLRQHAPIATAMANGSALDLARATTGFPDLLPLISWLHLPEASS